MDNRSTRRDIALLVIGGLIALGVQVIATRFTEPRHHLEISVMHPDDLWSMTPPGNAGRQIRTVVLQFDLTNTGDVAEKNVVLKVWMRGIGPENVRLNIGKSHPTLLYDAARLVQFEESQLGGTPPRFPDAVYLHTIPNLAPGNYLRLQFDVDTAGGFIPVWIDALSDETTASTQVYLGNRPDLGNLGPQVVSSPSPAR